MKQYIKSLSESIEYVFFDDYGPESFDEIGVDEYDAADAAHKIANSSGLNILSDKNLVGVLIDTDNKQTIGGLWISNNDRNFSFDIAIKKEYRNKGISHKLIVNAIQEYNYQNDVHQEMYDEPLPMLVDVVNPIMVKTLEKHYGFKVTKSIDTNRVLMSL